MFKRLVSISLVGMGLVPAVVSAQEAVSPTTTTTTTTTPPATPVPAPAPTQEPTGLGTDGTLDQLASGCFNGSMQACDELYQAAPVDSAYETYGDTCAGRQAPKTRIFCVDAFLDGPGMGQPVGPTTTAVGPTTTSVAVTTTAPAPTTGATAAPTTIPESVMFGVGAATGHVVAACPVGQHVNHDDVSACLPNSSPLPPGTLGLATDADCPIEGDLEHPDPANEEVFTFTEPSQMKTFVECILPEALGWMAYEYGSLDVPAEWVGSQATSLMPNAFLYVPTGVVGAVIPGEGCRGEDADGNPYRFNDQDLAYCRLDGYIYLGEQALWQAYNEFGDADTWGTIGHEWGHRIQQLAGPGAATNNEQIAFENQADCFSGSFLDYSARFTPLGTPSTPDDIFDMFIGLFNIGDPRIGEPEQNHGTIDQRIRAFYVGYNSADNQGAWACDFYVTSGSIIPPSRTGETQTTVES